MSGCDDPCSTGNTTPTDVILVDILKAALPWPRMWPCYSTTNDTVYERTNPTPNSNLPRWNCIIETNFKLVRT